MDDRPRQPGDPDAFPELNPTAETSLRLYEIAVLTRREVGGDPDAQSRLAVRREALTRFLLDQEQGFHAGHTYYGTMHYLSTEPTYAACRDTLLPLFRAASQGRDALRASLRDGASLAARP